MLRRDPHFLGPKNGVILETPEKSLHSGVTLDIVLEVIRDCAIRREEGSVMVMKIICQRIFPHTLITLEEIPQALTKIASLRQHGNTVAIHSDLTNMENHLQAIKSA